MKATLQTIKNSINLSILSLLCALVISSGCAVGMAASGDKKVRTEIIEVGQSRLVVEEILGRPVTRTEDTKERRTDVYEFQTGDEGSTGRAWFHGIMDVLTLTLWEIPASIYEGVQGDMYTMQISYGPDDRVIEIGQVTAVEPQPITQNEEDAY